MPKLDFLLNDYNDDATPAEKVFDELASDIITGKLKDGERLIEAELASRYGMSRTPVREVLNRLAASGFITLIPNRGAVVNGISARDINDCYRMKCILLPQCVRWAVERITEEEYDMLEETMAFMKFYTETEDLDKMLRINRGFHTIIYRASHNPELIRSLEKYDLIIHYSNSNFSYPANYLSTVLEEHQKIFDAFTARDPEAGAAATETHAYMTLLRRV